MEQASSDAMAARDALPVLEILFLFFTGRGGSFLSQKEKEKNGGAAKRAGLARLLCNLKSSKIKIRIIFIYFTGQIYRPMLY